jgi:uncharacterized membrane protein
MEGLIEVLFELLFEVFGDVLLQVVLEALAEVGVHLVRGKAEHPKSTSAWRLLLGYTLFGAIVGGLSLLVLPHALAHSHAGRVATLLVAPLCAALSTVAIGRLRVRRGQQIAGIDRFMYSYLFALALAVVRHLGATS